MDWQRLWHHQSLKPNAVWSSIKSIIKRILQLKLKGSNLQLIGIVNLPHLTSTRGTIKVNAISLISARYHCWRIQTSLGHWDHGKSLARWASHYKSLQSKNRDFLKKSCKIAMKFMLNFKTKKIWSKGSNKGLGHIYKGT